ncbi:hypothetical protein SDC9_119454 [bioreactor metagenome]|uniref:Uncharacterized protein n=1 Tax=bioreactor metagenome TaxID=1076179 RepID=A0A645C532_9ZZZZ
MQSRLIHHCKIFNMTGNCYRLSTIKVLLKKLQFVAKNFVFGLTVYNCLPKELGKTFFYLEKSNKRQSSTQNMVMKELSLKRMSVKIGDRSIVYEAVFGTLLEIQRVLLSLMEKRGRISCILLIAEKMIRNPKD